MEVLVVYQCYTVQRKMLSRWNVYPEVNQNTQYVYVSFELLA